MKLTNGFSEVIAKTSGTLRSRMAIHGRCGFGANAPGNAEVFAIISSISPFEQLLRVARRIYAYL